MEGKIQAAKNVFNSESVQKILHGTLDPHENPGDVIKSIKNNLDECWRTGSCMVVHEEEEEDSGYA